MIRLLSRESSAIVYYRSTMKLSINKIAMIMQRSTRTIQKLINKNRWLHKLFDMRHVQSYVKNVGMQCFRMRLKRMMGWCYMWLMGYTNNIDNLSRTDEPP